MKEPKKILGLGALFLVSAGLVCGGLAVFRGVGVTTLQDEVAQNLGEETMNTVGEKSSGGDSGNIEVKQVEVRIASSGIDKGMLYVSGEASTTDDSGTCKYIIMDHDERVLRVVDSLTNRGSRTVTCARIVEAVEGLGEGPWRVKLAYNSLYVFGESREAKIEAQ